MKKSQKKMDIRTINQNIIHCGDCLDVLKSIKPNSVDLIYLDPPFFTDRKHKLKSRDRTIEFNFDDIWESDREYTKFFLKENQYLATYREFFSGLRNRD